MGSDDLDGLLVVDKAGGWTSHDVVARVRRLAGTRKVGHAGTLDPMATGVLLVGLGRATRLLGHLALADKAYLATIRLGRSTVTDDAEGDVVATVPAGGVTDSALHAAVAALTGPLQQVPSSVSAVKVGGARAYAKVRAGQQVDLPARPVTVSTFDVLAVRRDRDLLDVDVSVVCSTGTYVRALARDLGAALGVGGHLTALRRTRVGPFTADQAHRLEDLAAAPTLPLLPLVDAVAGAFPRRDLTADEARRVRHGGPLAAVGLGPGPVGVFDPDGSVLALVEERQGTARPLAVFVAG